MEGVVSRLQFDLQHTIAGSDITEAFKYRPIAVVCCRGDLTGSCVHRQVQMINSSMNLPQNVPIEASSLELAMQELLCDQSRQLDLPLSARPSCPAPIGTGQESTIIR